MTDIETRLRAAFGAAAQVITVDDPDAELLLQPRRPRGRVVLWALAAAAAVIVAVAALAVALRPDRGTPQPPTQRHSSSVTQHPVVHSGLHAKSCEVRLPDSWRRAMTTGRVTGYLQLRTVDADGNAYAVQTLGTTSRLVRIDAHKYVTPVYIAPGGSRVGDVAVDGGWALISLIYGGNPHSGGGEAQGLPTGIVVIRVGASERDAITVRQGSAKDLDVVLPPVLSRGVVYWAAGDSSGRGDRHAFTIATHKDRILAHGMTLTPFIAGGGVYWSNGATTVTQRAGHFPPGYGGVRARGIILQSGSTYVWQVTVRANWVLRMSDGGPAPVTVLRPADGDANLVPSAISGDLLFYDDGSRMSVLDTSTGATALLPAASEDQVYAGGGEIAVQSGAGVISLLRTADLPALRC